MSLAKPCVFDIQSLDKYYCYPKVRKLFAKFLKLGYNEHMFLKYQPALMCTTLKLF